MDAASWIVTALGLAAMAWVVWYFWLHEPPFVAAQAGAERLSSASQNFNETTPVMNMQTETLTIDGMTCGHCVNAVRAALEDLDGVEVEHIEIGAARVRCDPAQTDRAALDRAVEEAGYTVTAHA